jgi:hypothetical protein
MFKTELTQGIQLIKEKTENELFTDNIEFDLL